MWERYISRRVTDAPVARGLGPSVPNFGFPSKFDVIIRMGRRRGPALHNFGASLRLMRTPFVTELPNFLLFFYTHHSSFV